MYYVRKDGRSLTFELMIIQLLGSKLVTCKLGEVNFHQAKTAPGLGNFKEKFICILSYWLRPVIGLRLVSTHLVT